jgi:hypothetical protein
LVVPKSIAITGWISGFLLKEGSRDYFFKNWTWAGWASTSDRAESWPLITAKLAQTRTTGTQQTRHIDTLFIIAALLLILFSTARIYRYVQIALKQWEFGGGRGPVWPPDGQIKKGRK